MNGPLDMIHTIETKPSPDDLQRREYAKAALMGLLAGTTTHGLNWQAAEARCAFDLADAMLAEQKKREGR